MCLKQAIDNRILTKEGANHKVPERLPKKNIREKRERAHQEPIGGDVVGDLLDWINSLVGVVAWAVSADSAFHGPVVSDLRRSDRMIQRHEEDIFETLENRHHLDYANHPSSPGSESSLQDLSRLDDLQSIQNQHKFDDVPGKDPLYIVHFVPSPKPKITESSTQDPNVASTVSNEILQKILSASKGAKPGTPQFVVFAPVPSEEDVKSKPDGLSEMKIPGLNYFPKPPTTNGELDYEYEEELRKYQELLAKDDLDIKDQTSVTKYVGDNDGNNGRTTRKESIHVTQQNFSAGNFFHNFQQQPMHSSPSESVVNSFQSQFTQSPPQASQSLQQNYNQHIPQGHHSQHAQNQQQFHQNYFQHQAAHQQAASSPIHINSGLPAKQPIATDRAGALEPFGIKLSIGNGGGGGGGYGKQLLGGNYSPLGIIGSIVANLLPRPRLNLNGKVMFGVVLEKGVALGKNGQHK
ncbi:uncharacterized protein LOC129222946 [Uloborus diversus]|uniref:uncharacterized protein LOC129222946 n=1 Tax=Uloborus diversus TaxID=327109 RepID=UPI00240A3A81|nr:uncharacterized protein LOC129222946 [Uloborus diversus]